MEGLDNNSDGNRMIVGAATDVIAGETLILTAGGIDIPMCILFVRNNGTMPVRREYDHAFYLGVGTGPSASTSATTCVPPHRRTLH